MESEIYDCVIVGGGIAGLTAALYSSRASLKTLVISGEPENSESEVAGGQLMLTPEIANFPGFEGSGAELVGKVEEQARSFGTEIVYENAKIFDLYGKTKTVETDSGLVSSKTIILATGAVAKRLGTPGENELFGRGVSVCATCDAAFFENSQVAVVGGGDSAVEDALQLSDVASKVYVIHRRNSLKTTSPQTKNLQTRGNVEFIWEEEVREILGSETVSKVKIKSGRDLEIDGLFVAIGHNPRTEEFSSLIDLDQNGFILKNSLNSYTNVKGVFAAGDVSDPLYRQAITAAGQGCMAAIDALQYLRENAN